MAKHHISEESTVYHYTLLYRFTRNYAFYRIYVAFLCLWLLVDLIYWRLNGAVAFAGSIAAVLVIHAVIATLLVGFTRGTVPRLWSWGYAFPFFGYMPAGFVTVGSWNRANRHRLTIGFALIALLYVWLPLPWFTNAVAAHYFLLLPQLIYISRCVRINSLGLIKVNTNDISLYKS